VFSFGQPAVGWSLLRSYKKMFRIRSLGSFVVVALAAMAGPLYCTTITTYNSLAGWQTAESTTQTIDFSGLPGSMTFYSSGLTLGGVQFIGYSGQTSLGEMDTTSWFPGFGLSNAAFMLMSGPSSDIHIILPAAVTAVGFNLLTSNGGLPYTINLNDLQSNLLGTYTQATSGAPPVAFFGATSDTPIATIDLSLQGPGSGGTYAFVDNVSYGTATTQTSDVSDTPEAATFLLIGSGLVGLGIIRRRTMLA